MTELTDAQRRVEEKLERLTTELRAVPYITDPALIQLDRNGGKEVLGYDCVRPEQSAKGIYLGFEDLFRGTEDFVRARQAYYIDVIGDRHPVLDVGSGRGEFLDLMRDHAIPALGVDLLPEMVNYARRKGHRVEQAEANEYLASQPDGSLGAVFSAQVIEHMDSMDLLRFVALAHRKLRASGLLIMETVNMHSLAAAKNFWVDPTHVTPVFPEVAVALARLHGFCTAQVVFPNGTGDFEHDRTEQGEYALVAEKGK